MGIPLGKAQWVNIELSQRDIRAIYPADWAAILEPQWLHLRKTAEVYALYVGESLKCIGIIFTEQLPELSPIETAFRMQFEDYDYLGYLFTPEAERKKGWGSLWIKKLLEKEAYPKIWLSIESIELAYFYQKLGFKPVELDGTNAEEYLLYFP
ncbi:MAG: hypothetical protein RLZZ242_1025 [Bacteroidota bacterium]|jgi:GNAT superfamily N-acetyltransferase